MVFTIKSLLSDVAASTGSLDEATRLWQAVISCVEDTLLAGKSVLIPGLCRFMYIKTGPRDLLQGVKGRVFALEADFLRAYHCSMRVSAGKAMMVPCLSVNYSKLAVLSGLDKDRVRTLLAMATKLIGNAILQGDAVRINLSSHF